LRPVINLKRLNEWVVVMHIKNLGGTVSTQMARLAKDLCRLVLSRDIVLDAEHIPGITNYV